MVDRQHLTAECRLAVSIKGLFRGCATSGLMKDNVTGFGRLIRLIGLIRINNGLINPLLILLVLLILLILLIRQALMLYRKLCPKKKS